MNFRNHSRTYDVVRDMNLYVEGLYNKIGKGDSNLCENIHEMDLHKAGTKL